MPTPGRQETERDETAGVRRWQVGSAELALHGQDRSLVDRELGLFGVFDGVGAYAQSGEAAQLAADVVARRGREGGDVLEVLRRALQEADRLIGERQLGATTAVVARVVGEELLFASVGDSRLYHQPRGGELVQLTQDEGEGNLLRNALGSLRPRELDEVVPQFGRRRVGAGDRLLLVSDGVTGDFPPDLLSASDLAAAIADREPTQAAAELIRIARKHDDRTAVVVLLE